MKTGVHMESEPNVEEMFDDPIFLALIKRDGLTVEDIRKVIASYHENNS